MKLTVHRGTNEIGGTCVEIESKHTHILLDFGLPLVDKQGKGFDFNQYKGLPVSKLLKEGILPNIRGAYTEKPTINGVIISHAHADHYGLMQFLSKGIPVYLGKGTHEILKLNNIFLNQNNCINKPHYLKRDTSFQIGDIIITPYWNDHSAFDSYSFRIDADGKSLFYSGDFRGHGRKANTYKHFLRNAPNSIDTLLIEGTTIGRIGTIPKTEDDIELEFISIFNETDSINYIYTSSQNIDRIVSIYKACLRARKTLVVDIYTANVLHRLADFGQFPDPLKGYGKLKVLFTSKLVTKLSHQGHRDLVYAFQKYQIRQDEISANPGDYVIIVRPSMKTDLEKIAVKDGTLIYSLWEGYKKNASTKDFLDWLISKNFAIKDIHTSGHASVSTLKEYANSINPRNIIPIHTFNKKDYPKIFKQQVIVLDDNQTIEI